MSFLAPLYLLLASAAAVPLLLHLLRRRSGARVEFPAARYLLRAEREHSRKLRLRNLLLMLLRIAIVLFVALAAARPVGQVAGTGHAPTALAIVLDNSLSTSAVIAGRSLLERHKERALAAVAATAPEDRVWLVTADGRVSGGGSEAVADAIRRLEPLAGAGDLSAAVTRAAGLARAGGLPERRLAVLTDAQATSWGEPIALGDVDVLVYAPSDTPPVNRAVLEVTPRPERWTPRGALTARVRTTDSVTYRVTLTGGDGGTRTFARGTAIPDSISGTADLLVRTAPEERGWVAGAVELPPDELRGDDQRHFALWVGAPPRITLGEGSGPFVRTAVEAIAAGAARVNGAGPSRTEIDVVSADEVTRLPSLILAPADPVRIGAANRALERAGVPWRFGAARRGPAPVRGTRIDDVTASLWYALESSGPAPVDTLARVGGRPWVIAGDGYVLVASPLDPAATTLPVRAAFVPWIADLLTQRLGDEPGRALAVAPGDSVARPVWAEALELSPGESVALSGASFAAPARSGVYFLLAAGGRAGALVVDAEAEESDLRRLAPSTLGRRLGGRRASVVSAPDRFDAALFPATGRRPLVVPFLLAALLALIAESIVVRARARVPAAQAA